MDPLVLIMTVLVGGLLVWVILLGLYHPRSGADVLDWRPTRSAEMEAQNEIDDLEQMLEAANAKRRARGEPELTEGEIESRVMEDRRKQDELREAYLAAEESPEAIREDIEQMLARVNDGRRRRGEPELTVDEYLARIEASD